MIAGTLNEIIEVQEIKVVKNTFGEIESTEYEPKFKTRAEVVFSAQNRVNDNQELFYPQSVNFRVRFYHKIGELDIIVWKERKYRILAIEPNKKSQLIEVRTELINE